MSLPTKELMKLTLEEKLAHGGHPVLLFMTTEAFYLFSPAHKIPYNTHTIKGLSLNLLVFSLFYGII